MIEVLVFDLDDTLFPEHQFVRSGFKAVDAWLEKEVGGIGFFEKAISIFEAGNRGNVFNLTLDELSLVYDKSLIMKLVEVYRTHTPELQLYNDAKWALANYQDKKFGIITDGYLETQKNKIKALGIQDLIDVIVCTDEYGKDCWKPSQFSYRKIMKITGEAGELCVYIGDNPVKDFVTARKLGWKTVQICRVGGEYEKVKAAEGFEADITINSLYDLKGII